MKKIITLHKGLSIKLSEEYIELRLGQLFISEVLPKIGDQKEFRLDDLKLTDGGLLGQVYIKSLKVDVQFELGQINLEYDYSKVEIKFQLVKVKVLKSLLLNALTKSPNILINSLLGWGIKKHNLKINAKIKGDIMHITFENAIKDMVEKIINENSVLNMLSFEDISRGKLKKINCDTLILKLFQ